MGKLSISPADSPTLLSLQLQSDRLCLNWLHVLCNLSLGSAFGFLDCFSSLHSRPLWYPLSMVCHSKRGRSGGSRGGRGKQPDTSSVDPIHNLIPYHGFQTTHFTFQSNLNRPVITANITILFSEEEALPPIRVRLMSEPSPEAGQGISSHSNKQDNAGESLEKDQGERPERSEAPSASQPPDIVVSRIWEEMDSDTRPNDEDAGHGDAWKDNICLVVKTPQHEDDAF